jgi:hypothetical protein
METFPTGTIPVYGMASILNSPVCQLFPKMNFEQVLQHSLNELTEHTQQISWAIAMDGNEQ